MPTKRSSFSFILTLTTFLTMTPLAYSGGKTLTDQPSTRATASLKPYMAKFGAMLAGLEIIKLKEKKPDWEAINLTIQEMSSNLAEMQKADSNNVYKEYTDVLAAGLVQLKEQGQKKDKKIFDSVDKLSNTCFQCHSAHRPADFIMPKKEQRISEDSEK